MHEPPPLRIIHGHRLDPANHASGSGAGPDTRELLIADGRVVAGFSEDQGATARTIDATGMQVMPGAIDMHSHIASRGLRLAASLETQQPPESSDHAGRNQKAQQAQTTAEQGGIIGSARQIAQNYLRLGYTTVIDAAVPPGEAAFAHQQLDQMAGLDTGFLLEIGSDPSFIQTIAQAGDDAGIDYLTGLLETTRAFGLKMVNPGQVDALDQSIDDQPVTPRRLLKVAARAAAAHGLSHPLHVHAPGLGEAGNVKQTIELIDALAGHPLHLAHAQFSAYASHADGHYTSGTRQLLNRFHQAGRVTMDTGCIGFGPAWMVTRDQLLARRLAAALKQTATYREGWAVMPMRYSPTNPINALQWAIGLELILRCEDRTRLALSVDFPNGGSFAAMPNLMELLSSPEKREEMLESLHPWAKQRSELGRLNHALSDEALVTLTRYAPANALGLTHKGHLQPGADADIVIADRPFALPSLVIKAGRVVRENDRRCQDAPARRVS